MAQQLVLPGTSHWKQKIDQIVKKSSQTGLGFNRINDEPPAKEIMDEITPPEELEFFEKEPKIKLTKRKIMTKKNKKPKRVFEARQAGLEPPKKVSRVYKEAHSIRKTTTKDALGPIY